MSLKKESAFQASLIRTLQNLFPGCRVDKNDPNYRQGSPDLTIKYGCKWADLEVKRSAEEPHQPNQDYYINQDNESGGFGRFVYPENVQQVLEELAVYFSNM